VFPIELDRPPAGVVEIDDPHTRVGPHEVGHSVVAVQELFGASITGSTGGVAQRCDAWETVGDERAHRLVELGQRRRHGGHIGSIGRVGAAPLDERIGDHEPVPDRRCQGPVDR
jgi:hypothetical protein